MRKVLVAPLHWGLGHATRCIPIIRALIAENFEVLLASDGAALQILHIEFPYLQCFELPSYNISYPSENMLYNGLVQSKNIFSVIRKEKKEIQNIVNQHNIDIIISDNRFGCYSKTCKNIFITHQINIKTGFNITDFFAKKINCFLINHFDKIWIPDVENEPSLAGELSHGYLDKLAPCEYLGVLSRFEKKMDTFSFKEDFDILVVLSGPEPQRTIIEKNILAQAIYLPYRFLIIRGIVTKDEPQQYSDNIKIYPYFDAKNLNFAFAKARLIIARSGYTTLMDLALTGKKALLIPTPGQTEQEYLAKALADKNIYSYQIQATLNLAEAIPKALDMETWQPIFDNNLKEIVKKL